MLHFFDDRNGGLLHFFDDKSGGEGLIDSFDLSDKALSPISYILGKFAVYMRLLHEGDLWRCFRDSGSVTYVSTLPAP